MTQEESSIASTGRLVKTKGFQHLCFSEFKVPKVQKTHFFLNLKYIWKNWLLQNTI